GRRLSQYTMFGRRAQTPPSQQPAGQAAVQLDGQQRGQCDFDGVAGQVGQHAQPQRGPQRGVGQQQKPYGAQGIAGGTAGGHGGAQRPKPAAGLAGQRADQQRGGQIPHRIAAGAPQKGGQPALEPRQ